MDFFRILQGGTGVGMSNFDRLWSQKFNDNWPIITLSGSLPLTFLSKGGALTNYRVYGATSGVGDETENLFDYTARDTENGYVNGSKLDEYGVPATQTGWAVSEYINVDPSADYGIDVEATNLNYWLAFYDESKNFISSVKYNNRRTFTFTTPEQASVMRFSIYKSNADKVMLTNGSTAPDGRIKYIPHGYQIPLTVTSGVTKNIYDKDAKDPDNGYISNRRIAAATGLTYQASGHFITEYIAVKPNTIYTLDGMVNSISLSLKAPGICFYDANKAFISGIAFSRSSEKWVASDKKVTSPENAAYARFNIDDDSADTAMLIVGSTAPDHYIPHRYTADYNLYIGDTKLGEEEYVDYQEQKVYKKSSNVWNGNVEKWNKSNRIEVTDNGNGTFTLQKSYSTAGAFPAVKVGQVLEAGKKYEIMFTISGMTSEMIATNPVICLRKTTNAINKQIIITADGTYKLLTDAIPSDVSYAFSLIPVYDNVSVTFSNVVVSDISIKEIVPTDPPVPFPSVQTFSGENTLDSTETIEQAEITGKIKAKENENESP